MLKVLLRKIYHFIAFLMALPFVLMTELTLFVYVAELISLIPFRLGELIRYYFYKKTLAACGDDIVIGFGTVLSYSSITIGSNVSIGPYNSFGRVDIGDYTLTAQYCNFLSGAHLHGFAELDKPIMQQLGKPERIKIGPDIWVGATSTVMANIGKGCVIGAGSVVTKDIPDNSIAVGNPARVIRTRK